MCVLTVSSQAAGPLMGFACWKSVESALGEVKEVDLVEEQLVHGAATSLSQSHRSWRAFRLITP